MDRIVRNQPAYNQRTELLDSPELPQKRIVRKLNVLTHSVVAAYFLEFPEVKCDVHIINSKLQPQYTLFILLSMLQ